MVFAYLNDLISGQLVYLEQHQQDVNSSMATTGIMSFQEKGAAIQAHPNPRVVSFNRHFVRGSIKIRCGSAEQEANTTHVGFYII